MSIITKTYGTEKNILLAEHQAFTIGCVVGNTGVTAGSDGRKIIKAGTPVGSASADVLPDSDVVLNVSSATVSGIVLHDVDVTAGNENATLIISGTVDLLKIDETTRALITTTVKTALPKITFVNGRA
jgi:hypothetical protein